MLNYEKVKLENGLRTIFVPIKGLNALTCLFLVNTGSRFEEKRENGISHFLEHLFFKGTKLRPTTQAIANELDSIGASYNAFTSEEYTGFYVSAAKTKIEKAVDILSDIIINSKFGEAEIEKEKGVIVEEINMYNDLPQKMIIDLTKKHFFGNTPLGRSVLGTKEMVRKFSRLDFIKYKKFHYTSKNSVLVFGGSFKKIKAYKLAKRGFSSLDSIKNKSHKKLRKINKKKSLLIKYKKTDQAHLTIGLNTFKRTSKNRYTFKIINNILGETMSSRLFSEVREKRGLAYYVGSDTWYFADVGALVAYAGIDIKRINEAVKVIKEQILKMSKNSITQKEVQRAKDNIEGKMYLNLENSFAVSEFFAENELLYNKIEKPEEIVKKIKSVNLDEINALCQKIIKSKHLKLTIIGPYKNKSQFTKLI